MSITNMCCPPKSVKRQIAPDAHPAVLKLNGGDDLARQMTREPSRLRKDV